MKLIKQKNGDVIFKFDSEEQEYDFINGFLEYNLLMQNDITPNLTPSEVTFAIETENGLKPWEEFT